MFADQPGLGDSSLFKMEQRLVRQGVLDREALADLTAYEGPRLTGTTSGLERRLLLMTADAPQPKALPPAAQLAIGKFAGLITDPAINNSHLPLF